MEYRVIVPPIENTYPQGYILLFTYGGVVRAKISEEEIKKIDNFFSGKYLPDEVYKELKLEKDVEGNYYFLQKLADDAPAGSIKRRLSFVDGIILEHLGKTTIYAEE